MDKETLYVLMDEVFEIDDKNDRSTAYIIQHLIDTVGEFDYKEDGKDAHDITMDYLMRKEA